MPLHYAPLQASLEDLELLSSETAVATPAVQSNGPTELHQLATFMRQNGRPSWPTDEGAGPLLDRPPSFARLVASRRGQEVARPDPNKELGSWPTQSQRDFQRLRDLWASLPLEDTAVQIVTGVVIGGALLGAASLGSVLLAAYAPGALAAHFSLQLARWFGVPAAVAAVAGLGTAFTTAVTQLSDGFGIALNANGNQTEINLAREKITIGSTALVALAGARGLLRSKNAASQAEQTEVAVGGAGSGQVLNFVGSADEGYRFSGATNIPNGGLPAMAGGVPSGPGLPAPRYKLLVPKRDVEQLRDAAQVTRYLAKDQVGSERGLRAPAQQLASTKTSKPWDPIARLPDNLQKRLSEGDRALLTKVIRELQQEVEKHDLPYVPVFGYLSLRHDNYRELGMNAQSEVVAGTHVEKAILDGHAIDVVASTVFRGTPEHPGVVAGLSQKSGQQVPGVMLKIPRDQAEELLPVLLAREFFAEGDLRDRSGPNGAPISNSMYAPAIETVTVGEGKHTREERALVFRTNPDGAKFLGDLTTEQLAHLMAAEGGFVDAAGNTRGGAARKYWEDGYLKARAAANEPIDPRIAAAVELAPLFPTMDVLRRLSTRNDADAVLIQKALRFTFKGAASPLALKQEQADGLPVTRPPRQEAPTDLEARLLEWALKLKKQHPADFE